MYYHSLAWTLAHSLLLCLCDSSFSNHIYNYIRYAIYIARDSVISLLLFFTCIMSVYLCLSCINYVCHLKIAVGYVINSLS